MLHSLQLALRTLAASLLLATLVPGQSVLTDSKKIAEAKNFLDTLQGNQSACEVFPLKPHFIYSLRMNAGFVVYMPKEAQSAIEKHKWIVITRITPQDTNGVPVYLAEVTHFTNGGAPLPKIEGSYWLGEGRYNVKFLMFDAGGTLCRKDWQIDARVDPGTRQLKMILPAGTVEASAGIPAATASAAMPLNRLTILLHASSFRQLQTVLGNLDKSMLLDGLVALMEELPARSVRLVVFNLQERKELLRQDNFTLAALPQVAKLLDAVQSAVVDYRTLQNPHGTIDFIENLFEQEMQDPEPSDAVVLLGPKSVFKDKPSPQFASAPASKSRFFYLMSEPTYLLSPPSSTHSASGWRSENFAMGLPDFHAVGPAATAEAQQSLLFDHLWTSYGPNQGRDSLDYAVSRLHGKTLAADNVQSFTSAIAAITRASARH